VVNEEWRVLSCLVRMLRIGITGDCKSRGNRLSLSLTEACQKEVTPSMSSCHANLTQAHGLAIDRPKLSGCRSSSAKFASVFWFCITHLWEDSECRPEELWNGVDWCQHDRGEQRKTGTIES